LLSVVSIVSKLVIATLLVLRSECHERKDTENSSAEWDNTIFLFACRAELLLVQPFKPFLTWYGIKEWIKRVEYDNDVLVWPNLDKKDKAQHVLAKVDGFEQWLQSSADENSASKWHLWTLATTTTVSHPFDFFLALCTLCLCQYKATG
jgi:hypothetical protein